MAYHYLVNVNSLECKTVRTETLDRYDHADGWRVFDTEEARDAAKPDFVFYANATNREIRGPMTPARAEADGYTRTSSWKRFATKAEAEAWLPGKLYALEGLSIIERWDMAGTRQALENAGYTVFTSKAEAEAAKPPHRYMIRYQGSVSTVMDRDLDLYRERGYSFGATRDAAVAALPPLFKFHWERAKYQRKPYTEAEQICTQFRIDRRFIRTAALNLASDSLLAGDVYIDVRETLLNVWQRFLAQHLRYCPSYHREADTDARTRDLAAVFAGKLTGIMNAWRRKHPDEVEEYRDTSNDPEPFDPDDYETDEEGYYLDDAGDRVADPDGNWLTVRAPSDRDYGGCVVCSMCGVTPALAGQAPRAHDGGIVCQHCQATLRRCHHCNTLFPPNMTEHCEEDGQWYCTAHVPPPVEAAPGTLLAYQADVTRRRPCFLTAEGERKPSLWLGWELECHAAPELPFPEVVERVRELFGQYVILKRDGSLKQNGMEIVSIPASLAWHRANTAKFLQDVKPHLEGWKHPDCGIHIHVGKAEVSKLTQARLLTFVHDPDNQQFITGLAGREPNNYAVRGQAKKPLPYYRQEAGEGRYQALNFATRKQATIEFRIFRSNVSPAGFMKNLEFVAALVSWCALAGNQEVSAVQVGIRGRGPLAGYNNFLLWLASHRGEYPVLVKWCEENAYMRGRASVSPSAAA